MEKRNDTIHKCNTDGTLRDHDEMDDKQRRAIHGIWSAATRIALNKCLPLLGTKKDSV